MLFSSVEKWAKINGVNVERDGRKYQVWTTGAVVAECENLKEVVQEVKDFIFLKTGKKL